jgi:hypothetical protein
MSHGRAIDPLPLDEFPTEQDASDPGFEQLFNDLVGDAATPADGFDDDVAIANSILDQLDGALGELGGQTGGTLDDTFAEILTVDPNDAQADVSHLTAALPDFQTNVDNLGVILAGPPPVGPVPGGGGGRPSTCGSLDIGPHPFQVQGQVNQIRATVQLTNNQNQALKVKGITWTPPQTYSFIVAQDLAGAVIQPGGTLQFDILAANGDTSTTQATLTVNTDGPDPQPCLNVTAEWTPASASGGGSPITNCVKCADWACPHV